MDVLRTKELIKLIPFDRNFHEELYNRFDALSEDEKIAIEQIIWRTYMALFRLFLQQNLEIAMQEITDGDKELDSLKYAEIYEQTQKSFAQSLSQMADTQELSQAQEELGKIIKDDEV